jgi:hypothetical protein
MSYDKLAINLINKYIWDLAKGDVQGSTVLPSNIWNTAQWGQITPIFPVNENFGTAYTDKNPYILYDYVVSGASGTFWPLEKERSTYTIVGEIPSIYYVKNFIYDNLRKFDVSAMELNKHLNDSEINFKYIKVEQPNFIAQEFRPADSQLPKYQTTLMLTYEFTRS